MTAIPKTRPQLISEGNDSIKKKLSLFLFFCAFLVYVNTLTSDFALDDMGIYCKNEAVIAGPSAIPEILSTPYHHGSADNLHNDLYRPLSVVMFAVEAHVFSNAPGPSHFISVLIFSISVVLLFRFLCKLFDGRIAVAFIAVLLFALHPIHTESVANIKGRDDLLCFLFAVLSLNKFVDYKNGGNAIQCIFAAFFYFLSLMSKESSIFLLGIIPLVFFFYQNQDRRKSVIITISAFLAAAIYLFIRHAVLSNWSAGDTSNIAFEDNLLIAAPDAATRLATAIFVLGKYLKLLFIPYPLISDYSFNLVPFVTFGNVWVLLSLLAYTFIVTIGIYRLLKIQRDPYAFGILFFLGGIVLFSNIPFLIGSQMAERFLFFASAGFCLIIGLLCEKLLVNTTFTNVLAQLRDKKVLAVILPVGLVFSGLTLMRNAEWKNSETLFAADVRKAPECARINYWYSCSLLDKYGSPDIDSPQKKILLTQAKQYLNRSLATYPAYYLGESKLSYAFFLEQNFDSTYYHLRRATTLNPKDEYSREYLDNYCFQSGRYRLCIDLCKEIITSSSAKATRYNNIGISFMHLQQYDSAICYLKKGADLIPAYYSFYEDLALSYQSMKMIDSARKYEAMAQKYSSSFKLK